ncbi:MAG: alpha-glucosidase [Deltaproteobacteria bacterium]|nr:alpha-glucosidase [Deltaproteobacteria bacterium]
MDCLRLFALMCGALAVLASCLRVPAGKGGSDAAGADGGTPAAKDAGAPAAGDGGTAPDSDGGASADAGSPGPDAGSAPADCFSPNPGALPEAATGKALSAGDFRLVVTDGGSVDVRHVAAPARSLFASAAGAPLEFARTDVHVVDRQGSFEVQETVLERCAAPRLDSLRAGEGVVALGGGFADVSSGCAGLTWSLQWCEARPGHLSFRLGSSAPSFNRATLRVASEADERIFGLGEQFPHDTLDLKGRVLPVLSQEGGVGRGHIPITPLVNAVSPGSGGSEASTYDAAPHYLTSRLRSLFLEDTEVATFDFSAPAATRISLFAPSMTGRVLFGSSPLELVERFTEYAGRMPPPPAWVDEGAIVALARDLGQSRARVAELLGRGTRISGVWNQTWSGKVTTFIGEQVLWNWVQNPATHPDWDGFVDDMADAGIRTLCYVNPMFVDPPDAGSGLRNLYAEALDAGYFVAQDGGAPYLLRVTAFDVGLLDLSNPAAQQWMKDVLKAEVMGRARCSGWMVDFAEALPFEAVLDSGVGADRYHNQYPVDWMRLNREAIDESGRLGDILTWNRSGAARTPTHSLMMWEGDQLTTWDKYDGLRSALHGLVSGGLSGLALNHSDTGGYTSLSASGILGYEREAELLKRWTEMNAFTALLRTHEGNQPAVNAQVYSDGAGKDHFARMSRVYRALRSYRRQLYAEAQQRGWPVVRALWLHAPDDARALDEADEFTLGRDLLVAPILNKCFTWPVCPYSKAVYLPPGEWVHLWSGTVYGSAASGTDVTVAAPMGEPAVFYRKGAAMAAPFVSALQAEGITVPAAK